MVEPYAFSDVKAGDVFIEEHPGYSLVSVVVDRHEGAIHNGNATAQTSGAPLIVYRRLIEEGGTQRSPGQFIDVFEEHWDRGVSQHYRPRADDALKSRHLLIQADIDLFGYSSNPVALNLTETYAPDARETVRTLLDELTC